MTAEIIIAVYAAVAYIVAVVGGLLGCEDYLVFFLSMFWPIAVPMVALLEVGDKVEEWLDHRQKLREAIGSALYIASLLFRPRQIGIKIASFVRRLRNSRKERK
jgi:hypothetical protein